ncbi:hypothetical protein PHYPSEUDO_000994 [Phytophthora pseudosyringae]|uniref:Transmembrane protein n=1 Tax=Phytophthora pseudosyringae TaxID=221518 RepID=A0A8T1W108_9STRA|nr:hypothetical protein PHYPSEUDO_000994 [Phytophthora pseudosyringae]
MTTSNFPPSPPLDDPETGIKEEHYLSAKSPRFGTTASGRRMYSSVGSLGGGALRFGEAPRLWSRECVGLFAQYAAVGLLYGALPGTIYPFLQNYLNVQGTQALAARVLVSLPWSFKVFYGIVSDCFPVGGCRRRPYMLLGWSICFAVLVVMACTSIGEPYYTDSSVRVVKPDNYTEAQRDSLNLDAPVHGGKYVVLLMLASVGYLMADVAADALVVEVAQREPLAVRGRTQTAAYTVRTVFMVVANLLLAFLFNGEDYGGGFEFTLSFPELMQMFACCAGLILPTTWFFIHEERCQAPSFRAYMGDLWGLLQTRAIFQVIAYKFFAGFFDNFTFVALEPMQTYWAEVTPLNEKLGNVLVLLVMALTLVWTGRYGLHWNWRVIMVVTTLTVVALDATCMLLVTWNVARNQYFWLALPIVEQFMQGVGFIVSTYVVVELAEFGHEGALYGLLTTVGNLSSPFAATISKTVNAPFNITNERLQNDEREVRWDITATLLIMYGMRLLSLIWLPLLPTQKEATQYLKATGGTNKFMGYVTAAYVLFALAWSVVTNLLSILPDTSCLTIAGGNGCDS